MLELSLLLLMLWLISACNEFPIVATNIKDIGNLYYITYIIIQRSGLTRSPRRKSSFAWRVACSIHADPYAEVELA